MKLPKLGFWFYFSILLILFTFAYAVEAQSALVDKDTQLHNSQLTAQQSIDSHVKIAITTAKCEQKVEDTFTNSFESQCLADGNSTDTCQSTTLSQAISYSLLSPGTPYATYYKEYITSLNKC